MPFKKKGKATQRRIHAKVEQVTDEDGWTHVVRGPAAVRAPQKTCPESESESESKPSSMKDPRIKSWKTMAAYELSGPAYESIADIEKEVARQFDALKSIKSMERLRQAVLDGVKSNTPTTTLGNRGITVAVCLGLGSLSRSRREASIRQLLAFETTMDILAEHGWIKVPAPGPAADWITNSSDSANGSHKPPSSQAAQQICSKYGIPVYFQDLHFSRLDEEFLTSRGYQVIHVRSKDEARTSRGQHIGPVQKHLSSSMFFYAPYLELDVTRLVIAAAPPAVYMGNSVDPNDESEPRSRHELVGAEAHEKAAVWAKCCKWYIPEKNLAALGSPSENWVSSIAVAFCEKMVEERAQATKNDET